MWCESKFVAEILGVKYYTLVKSISRSTQSCKNFCTMKGKNLPFAYDDTAARGGNGGKTLKIWLDDELVRDDWRWAEASEKDDRRVDEISAVSKMETTDTISQGGIHESAQHPALSNSIIKCGENEAPNACVRSGEVLALSAEVPKTPNKFYPLKKIKSLATFNDTFGAYERASARKKHEAYLKFKVCQNWLEHRAKGVKIENFLSYINSIKNYSDIKPTRGKLYEWLKKYHHGKLDALIDERKNNKTLKIDELGLRESLEKLILSCAAKGRVNVEDIYKNLNYHAFMREGLDVAHFISGRAEIVSYGIVARAVGEYKRSHRDEIRLISAGVDGLVSSSLPALGDKSWDANAVNDIVEIDASPLDIIAMCADLEALYRLDEINSVFASADEFSAWLKEYQKRYCIIGLIDVYSGVACFYIGESENSISIVRALAKYILKFGVPRVLRGDNGKAFKSKYIQSVLARLNIAYSAVLPYSGYLKPFVERNFRALQHSFSANMSGFIGNNIKERQAIEFQFSKKERRTKKNVKTNLKELHTLEQIARDMDIFADGVLNARALERLGGKTPNQVWSESMHEVRAMHPVELMSLLCMPHERAVSKKGINFNGLNFVAPAIFDYSSVIVRENLDDISEIFVYTPDDKQFICVAKSIEIQCGVSVEDARTSRQIFNQRVKKMRTKTLEAKEFALENMQGLLKAVAGGGVKPLVAPLSENTKLIEASTRLARAVGDNECVSDEVCEKSQRKEPKRIKSWEEFV